MEKKMGRPKKISAEEKIAIINRFYIEQTGEEFDAMHTHRIYRKLSEYAKSIGVSLEPYDFSKDEAARSCIATILAAKSESNADQPTIPTYHPLDITSLLCGSRKKLEDTMRDRETYFESLHRKAAKAIENATLLARRCDHIQADLQEAQKQCTQLEAEKKALHNQLVAAKKDIAYLKRIIRRDVEPERAQEFLRGLTSQDAAIGSAKKSVLCNLDSLCKEDLRLREAAAKEADLMDLTQLFSSNSE